MYCTLMTIALRRSPWPRGCARLILGTLTLNAADAAILESSL